MAGLEVIAAPEPLSWRVLYVDTLHPVQTVQRREYLPLRLRPTCARRAKQLHVLELTHRAEMRQRGVDGELLWVRHEARGRRDGDGEVDVVVEVEDVLGGHGGQE